MCIAGIMLLLLMSNAPLQTRVGVSSRRGAGAGGSTTGTTPRTRGVRACMRARAYAGSLISAGRFYQISMSARSEISCVVDYLFSSRLCGLLVGLCGFDRLCAFEHEAYPPPKSLRLGRAIPPRWRGIDATLRLAQSPNTKIVVIGPGKNGLPIILNADTLVPEAQPSAATKPAATLPPTN